MGPGWMVVMAPLVLQGQTDSSSLARARESVVLIRAELDATAVQQGSGVVLGPGLVATNAHVVQGAQTIRVTKDGRSWQATELCIASDRDLAILKVPGLVAPQVKAASPEQLSEGQAVVALGYPAGQGPSLEPGRIVSLWNYRGDRLIQSDATTRPGSSGGGLFTEDGRLLGITTFVFPGGKRFNFSVPVTWVMELLASPSNLHCPAIGRPYLLKDSADLIAEAPGNQARWEALAQTWVQDSPKDPDAWCALGEAIERRLGQALEDDGQAPPPEEVRRILEAFTRTVALNPKHARAWNNLGASLDLQNRFEEAQRAYRTALRLQPDYGLAWINLGNTLVNSGALTEASEAFRKGLTFLPDDSQAWQRLAYCQARLKHFNAAAAYFRTALRFQPFRSDWWAECYQSHIQAGEPEQAEAALVRLRALSPELAGSMERWQRTTRTVKVSPKRPVPELSGK